MNNNNASRKIVFENCSLIFNHNKYNHVKQIICSWVSIWFLGEWNDVFIDGLPPESFVDTANSLNAFMERINKAARRNKKNEFQNKMRKLIGV